METAAATPPAMPAPPPLPLPDPRAGWSRSVMRLSNAVIDPAEGGVWQGGVLCPEAALWRWNRAYRGGKGTAPANPAALAGRHLWGGALFFHFGHFLVESLVRLWGTEASGAASILFAPKSLRGKRPDALAGYQQRIFALLGVHVPVRIVYEPLLVEDLIIPGQGFGLGKIARGTPEFRQFARRLDPGPGAPMAGRKLYISRSALPKKTGSILGEAALEANLIDEGFEIYHPQNHSIDAQLRTFRDTTHFLGPDGSAFHLAGFIAQPHQTFTLIKRRSAREYVNFVEQLEAARVQVTVIDALAANWTRPIKAKADQFSWGEVDFTRLSDELLRLGLISTPLSAGAERADHAAELAQIAQVHDVAMTRLPTEQT